MINKTGSNLLVWSTAHDNGNWTRLCFGLLYELVQLYGIYLEWFSGKQQWINWTMVWNILWTGAFVVILKKSKMDIIKWNGEVRIGRPH